MKRVLEGLLAPASSPAGQLVRPILVLLVIGIIAALITQKLPKVLLAAVAVCVIYGIAKLLLRLEERRPLTASLLERSLGGLAGLTLLAASAFIVIHFSLKLQWLSIALLSPFFAAMLVYPGWLIYKTAFAQRDVAVEALRDLANFAFR